MPDQMQEGRPRAADVITMFLCGDVMTGRGIDQVLPHPGEPRLFERDAKSAREYVELAEMINGPIPRPVDFAYVWGEALDEFRRVSPDVRVINLETSVTRSEDYLPKGINYRMNPENVTCITLAGIDCCVLANNHALDWGCRGLLETLETLERANVKTAGAGGNLRAAAAPAVLEVSVKGRVLVFSFGSTTSGIPHDWAAAERRPGINLLEDLSERTATRIVHAVREAKRPGDVAIASIHWGENWGYQVPAEQRRFAHALIDIAAVDVVHGHSSHHAKAIEVYKSKAILYGCGDFLTDYEGIAGYEEFRDDLVLMYFLDVDTRSGDLRRLRMVPLHIRRFRLERASPGDSEWLRGTLDRECRKFGARVEPGDHDDLTLTWA